MGWNQTLKDTLMTRRTTLSAVTAASLMDFGVNKRKICMSTIQIRIKIGRMPLLQSHLEIHLDSGFCQHHNVDTKPPDRLPLNLVRDKKTASFHFNLHVFFQIGF